jgi:3-oxoacyl-[acyl-carrier protein] reductase
MNMARKALVIGGSGGIGKAIGIRLARDGYHVVIHYRNNHDEAKRALDHIMEIGGSGELFQCDITDSAATVLALDKLLKAASLDVLVLSSGISRNELLVFMSEEQWDLVLDTNLRSFYAVVKPVVKQMLLARSGRIVAISSTSGQTGLPGQVHYSATKAGLIGAVKALALECAKRNVLVNAVTPGFIETDMTEDLNRKELESRVPLQRLGTPDEVAGVVSFLCSQDASYITGQVIAVNGGIYT